MTTLTNAAAFFALVRANLFQGVLTTPQVQGMNEILKASAAEGLATSWTSYVLATAYHETGQAMAPNRENMNYSEASLLQKYHGRITPAQAKKYGRNADHPADQKMIANIIYGGDWGLNNLGNTLPNDGWMMRGGGMDHCTGRRNYTLVDRDLGLKGALLHDTDGMLDVNIAARAIVTGMCRGRYTTKKLATYLPTDHLARVDQFVPARRIINGLDRAGDVAAYAIKFQSGLVAGGAA